MRFRSTLSTGEGRREPSLKSPRPTRFTRSVLPVLLVAAAGLAVTAAFPVPADAADVSPPAEDVRRARELYQEGDDAFRSGRYGDAYRLWQQGYALSARPLFLLNMAHAERRRGELASASSLYQRYLLVEPDTKLRSDVEAVLAEIDQLLARQKVGNPEPSAAHAPVPTAPASSPAPVADDKAAALLVEASRPPAEEPATEGRPLLRRWWFWAGAGSAVALGVAGAILLSRDSAEGPSRNGTLGTLGTAE